MRLVVLAVFAVQATAYAESSAEAMYDEADSAFKRGDYATALTKWQALYRISGETSLLFDIGQAHRHLGDCHDALSEYRRFIDQNPTSEHRALAEDFIRELEPTCPVTIVKPDERQLHKGHKPLIGILATTGIVLFATGVGLGYHGAQLGEAVTHECAGMGCDWATERGKDDAGRRDVVMGWTLAIAGGAALLGGAGVYYFAARQDTQASRLNVLPSSNGVALTWSGNW